MQGNKGQFGNNFIGMTVNSKKFGLCEIVHQMTPEEYEKAGKPRERSFTIKDKNGNLHHCSRSCFAIPR